MKSVKNGNFLLGRDGAVAAEGILMGILNLMITLKTCFPTRDFKEGF